MLFHYEHSICHYYSNQSSSIFSGVVCTQIESVSLALQLLDGLELRGHTLSAEKVSL